MDFARVATAIAVSLGIPVLAMVQPASPSLIGRAVALPAADATSDSAPPRQETASYVSGTPKNAAAASFGVEITRLSDEADGVDRLWQAYKEQCRLSTPGQDGFSREWFSILDRSEGEVDGSADCGELLQLIRQAGDGIRADLRRATATARHAKLDRGTEIGLLRWHSLELP